jgi:hypothetical protein
VGRAVPGEPKTGVATKATKRTKGGRREGRRERKNKGGKGRGERKGGKGCKIGLAGGRADRENKVDGCLDDGHQEVQQKRIIVEYFGLESK